LLWRDPIKNVPGNVFWAWLALWLGTLVFFLLSAIALVPDNTSVFGWKWGDLPIARWLFVALVGALAAWLHLTIQQTFGRVVRYTQSTPNNIVARKAVRERGLALLEKLHKGQQYQRVILVSHSLGTILAYELLAFFWARQLAALQVTEGTREFELLCELERLAALFGKGVNTDDHRRAWQLAQCEFRRLLAKRFSPAEPDQPTKDRTWLISDFVTLGSPLTHAQFLMASDLNDLNSRLISREFPTSPPFREFLDPKTLEAARATRQLPIETPETETKMFCFPRAERGAVWELHHAAPFAVVRWTNLYDPSYFLFKGDLISGAMQHVFGAAINDIDLSKIRGKSCKFTHTQYWNLDADERQKNALRQAINLLDESDVGLSKPRQESDKTAASPNEAPKLAQTT
jgi:hypothetical protein